MENESQPAALSREEKTSMGREDAGHYFRYMAGFVGFSDEDAKAIRESGLVLEKYLPEIVARFYTHLLTYPPTREHFINKDGKVDQQYLSLRMHHLTNFWRRTAGGEFDDDYARYVDYVGRAHTSHGADPKIYIAERYVIGQVGFMQHAISTAISKELHMIDPDLEVRALKAWNLLMMVILEMLSRAYSEEHVHEIHMMPGNLDAQEVLDLAVETYEHGLGLQRPAPVNEVEICAVEEIAEGERKIVQIGDLSIGIFHHKGSWYALKNSCLHRGGPVCTGTLEGDVLICPWHGYQYDVTTGRLLVDPSAQLLIFPISLRDNKIYLQVPEDTRRKFDLTIEDQGGAANEFLPDEIPPGKMRLLFVSQQAVTVYNANGTFYATQDACPHAQGPLHEGKLEGTSITCPWHHSCFDITNGKVLRGPAKEPLQTYRVIIENGKGRVERLQS